MLDTYSPTTSTHSAHVLAPTSPTPAGKRTKIVCTLGPATDADGVLESLITSGLDVARLNFSHGDHDDHARRYRAVRAAAAATGRTVAILVDLQGPKIRLGRFRDGHALWMADDLITITTDTVTGTADRVGTTYLGLAHDARPDDAILVDDGKLELRVERVVGTDVICRVIHGGQVSDNKGLSLPNMNFSAPALSDRDTQDLRFALALGVDLVALSFVRRADDINQVHQAMTAAGRQVPVIAKIEKPEAVNNLDAIIDAFDGVMVARGDLGVETPLEDVPHVQKRAIQTAREKAKPVVVATQMLDSMIDNARPTRAEASDVANAVLDGADAVMLSGETSIGRHPVDTVRTMVRIVAAAEQQGSESKPFSHRPRTRSGVVSYAARDIALSLSARALVAFTQSGDTLRRLARLHQSTPLIALTPDPAVHNQLAISWGTTSAVVSPAVTTDDMFAQVDEHLTQAGLCTTGDVVVVIAGSPPGTAGVTNLIRVHRIGESTPTVTPH